MARLSSFVGAMQGGGARANQFEVNISGRNVLNSEHFTFMCRSAQIPAVTIGEVLVPYRGRQIYVPGDRTYDAWTLTVYNDSNYSARDELERWQNEMQDIGATTVGINPTGVYRQASVKQLDRNDRTVRTYTLYDCWPQTLDAIDLAYDTNDTVEEFGFTMRFNYMTVTPGSGSGTRAATRSGGSSQIGSGSGSKGGVTVSASASVSLSRSSTGVQ